MCSKKSYTIKTLFLIVAILLSPCLLWAFSNEPEGFRGIKWGTRIWELSDMGIGKDAGNSRWYIRKDDKMKIGDADVEQIAYGFYQDRFYDVVISFTGSVNFSKIKETFQQLYGSGPHPDEFMERYFWLGREVNITLVYNVASNKGEASYWYKPIEEEKEAARKKGQGNE